MAKILLQTLALSSVFVFLLSYSKQKNIQYERRNQTELFGG